MFGISYIKVDPTNFVIHYTNGKVKRQGTGLAFYYFVPHSSIVAVPLASVDVPFIYNEITADFQPVTIQGQLTYRIVDSLKTAGLLNFTLAPDRKSYRSDDPEKLPQRIVNISQVLTRAEVQHLSLRAALIGSEAIVQSVLAAARQSETLAALGVELLAFSILGIRPTPEMAKALEAEAREELQRKSDEAIYARRNAAVEQERKIKENELSTEIAVEEKKRQIREAQMDVEIAVEDKKRQVREMQLATDIALEEQRQAWVSLHTANTKAEADAQAYALEATLKPLTALDPQTLLVLGARSVDPRLMIALSFKELAQNAAKIGQLNISPDLLDSLMTPHKN
jgi:hypothetical protein